ncbi:MAG TPA: DUF1801 domain-containing protein [Verrucomicrobiae bacterium]|nr:DUF1801 domain-containing protein [Verrucomicrobiae bacterium]
MSENKTKPTAASIESFLETVTPARHEEAKTLISMIRDITGLPPVLWGPSIIGFGTQHYKYDTGREGDMPRLGFSPRKASLTIYFEGFDRYGDQLSRLGKYKTSVSCLYITKLTDVDLAVLREMLEMSYKQGMQPPKKMESVEEYVAKVPAAARAQFDQLRTIVKTLLPKANEVVSYGIIGYKVDDKRARVFISGWKDHLAIYPVPKDLELQADLKPYIKGKGTLWFKLEEPLPEALIKKVVKALL